ncbi:MAG: heme ABC transporter ATP-binding protein [Verrucomicrobia bacterium Tous-C9LFEB]|nr:MAG: heme ABC transporter ATP-binding protein [Verrucomicrobia bacterium Tous-C9LFEB]
MSTSLVNSLQAVDVTVTVSQRQLIDAVSCAIVPGEILAVLGPNGAGKSTLIRSLSGEIKPSSGEIQLNGRSLSAYSSEAVARQRAVLPQTSPLAFPFAVQEVVLMGRAPHVVGVESEVDREIVRETMRRADVAHLAERNYLTLSGGEKQRVHWARVMAQLAGVSGPRYLLLDEPVSSLDMTHQHACLTLARELASQGVGILTVLHDLNLAAMYADRVLLLRQGRVIGQGTPNALLTVDCIQEVFAQRVVVMPHPQRDCPLIVVP